MQGMKGQSSMVNELGQGRYMRLGVAWIASQQCASSALTWPARPAWRRCRCAPGGPCGQTAGQGGGRSRGRVGDGTNKAAEAPAVPTGGRCKPGLQTDRCPLARTSWEPTCRRAASSNARTSCSPCAGRLPAARQHCGSGGPACASQGCCSTAPRLMRWRGSRVSMLPTRWVHSGVSGQSGGIAYRPAAMRWGNGVEGGARMRRGEVGQGRRLRFLPEAGAGLCGLPAGRCSPSRGRTVRHPPARRPPPRRTCSMLARSSGRAGSWKG